MFPIARVLVRSAKNTSFQEPNAGDGGAYRCTARNQLGESNANINLNFAGGGGDENKSKGPSFVGKPRIIPKDGGALIVMECKVKSPTPPVAKWMKDGVPLQMGGLYHAIFTDLGDQTYLCQLEIRGPSASDAGQYRCNLRNEQGETNANLALNFEEPDPNERQEKKGFPVAQTQFDLTLKVELDLRNRETNTVLVLCRWCQREVQLIEALLPYLALLFVLKQVSHENNHAVNLCFTRWRLTLRKGQTNNMQAEADFQNRRSPSEKRKDASSPRPPSRGNGSRPGSPKKSLKSREGTPKRSLKDREGSPSKKSMRSRTSTPVQEAANTLAPEDAVSPGDSRRSSKNMDKMEVDTGRRFPRALECLPKAPYSATSKRKPEGLPVPPSSDEKKLRRSSPVLQEQASKAAAAPDKRDKFTRPPIVMEAIRSQTGKQGDTIHLEVEWQCHTSTVIEWFK
ncbi:unnamed protein product [Heligmosomoides polygyrus]|uniref:Ig-like domain-containing protein n=1 Tax=Heligmosomoides polygyrus TaxID=6339 RepID=A0A3P7X303_HELPZ|nr:unnamed protein product [Heligmosomoides polygyrus]